MVGLTEYFPQFFTATILQWKPLLVNDLYKDIVADSLSFLVENNRIGVYGFVFMPNHIHIIWHMAEGHTRENVQRDFLKFTAQKIKAHLKEYDRSLLKKFYVGARDRAYQIWERNPLTIDIYTEKVMLQKLNYIHNNPIQTKWRLADLPWNYKYSSANFYQTGESEWKFLSHYLG